MKRILLLIMLISLSATVTIEARQFSFQGLTGTGSYPGTANLALDGWPEDGYDTVPALADEDFASGHDGAGTYYTYVYDASSTASESVPDVIVPNDSDGTGRWLKLGISLETNQNYVTDAQLVVIGNTSGTNTGDMSDSDVKTAYENNADTNAFTDAEKTVVGNTSGTNTGDQTISDATISITDITTNDVTSSAHGFAPKGSGLATEYLDGTGAYSVPAGGSGMVYPGTGIPLSTGSAWDTSYTLEELAIAMSLDEVDNTSDLDKPISTATQSALDGKADSLGADENYVTDAQLVVIGNTSGTNTGDMSNTDVKTAYEANADTNAYTDAEQTVVGNTSGTNTGDQIISDATISITDITTNDVSSSAHGFAPKGDGSATSFLNGQGAYTTPAGSGDALTTDPLSQFASTTSAQLAGVMSDETGSNLLVYNDTPTLIAPILGTPTSGVGTNLTGIPASTGLIGTAWTLFYVNASGVIVEIPLGADGEYLMSNGPAVAPSFETPSGTGDVVGPASSVSGNIPVFADTTGKLLSDSGDSLSDYGNLGDNETVTGDWDFSGSLGIGNILYNASLGTDDTYSGQGITGLLAGETIAQWDLVYLDATTGEYLIADADATGEWPAWGMAVATGTDGNALTIVQSAIVRNDGWSWTEKVPLYLDETTSGGLTETAPSTSGDCVQPVARSITSTIILLNVDPIFNYLEVE
jgi:hypothetical protein